MFRGGSTSRCWCRRFRWGRNGEAELEASGDDEEAVDVDAGMPGRCEDDELDRMTAGRLPRPCRHDVPWRPARAMQVDCRHVDPIDVQLRAPATRAPRRDDRD